MHSYRFSTVFSIAIVVSVSLLILYVRDADDIPVSSVIVADIVIGNSSLEIDASCSCSITGGVGMYSYSIRI